MSSELESKCRTCLSVPTNYHQLFDYVEGNFNILEMLDDVVPQIGIKKASTFCTIICDSCLDKLLIGYKFQQLCIETNNRLHGFLSINFEPKAEKILDPWTGEQCFKMKEELDEESYKVEIVEDGGLSDTYSSNEKTSIIAPRELSLNGEKIENGDSEMDNNTECKVKETENINLTDTCIRELVLAMPNRKRKNACEECGKTFNGLSLLKRHSAVHSLARSYECEICKYRFDTLNILKLHMSRHKKKTEDSPEYFSCPFCPKCFKKQEQLSGHLHFHKHNSAAANYLCKICHHRFMSIKSLTGHITSKHPEVEYKCDQCDKTFVLHARFLEHLNRHQGNKNLVCRICEEEIVGYNNMKEHMRTHRNESPLVCPHCGIELCNTSSLRRHLQNHALKKYQCPKCPSRFNFKEDMHAHLHTHNLKKSHQCSVCGKRLSNVTNLRRHMKIHTGLEAYPCPKCPSSFAHSSELKKHASTHGNAVDHL